MAIFRNSINKRYLFNIIFNKKFIDRTIKRYYLISKQNIFIDIRRIINRIKRDLE
jgi:hypothetical protein